MLKNIRMSKIIKNAEISETNDSNEFESADVICQNCAGEFQRVAIQSNGLFSTKLYTRWVYACTNCTFKSKVFHSNINK